MPWGSMIGFSITEQRDRRAEDARRRALHARAVERRRKAKRGGKR